MIKISKVIEVWFLIWKNNVPITYFLKKNASIASIKIVLGVKNLLTTTKFGTLIDVGANIGQFASAFNLFFPKTKIYSFEPVPVCFDKLKQNTSQLQNVLIHNLALGSSEGTIKFYQNDHSHASSALPISQFQKENLPNTKDVREIEVQVSTLDRLEFDLSPEFPVLLKLDVQGYEMEVLKGGRELLKKIDYILLETSFAPMYDNEPLFDDLHTYLKSEDFELMVPLDFLKSNGRILQMDVLYKREAVK